MAHIHVMLQVTTVVFDLNSFNRLYITDVITSACTSYPFYYFSVMLFFLLKFISKNVWDDAFSNKKKSVSTCKPELFQSFHENVNNMYLVFS